MKKRRWERYRRKENEIGKNEIERESVEKKKGECQRERKRIWKQNKKIFLPSRDILEEKVNWRNLGKKMIEKIHIAF